MHPNLVCKRHLHIAYSSGSQPFYRQYQIHATWLYHYCFQEQKIQWWFLSIDPPSFTVFCYGPSVCSRQPWRWLPLLIVVILSPLGCYIVNGSGLARSDFKNEIKIMEIRNIFFVLFIAFIWFFLIKQRYIML